MFFTWTLPLLFPLVLGAKENQEAVAPVNFALIFKEKCDGLPFRSLFVLDSMTCYISLSSKMDCSEISLIYAKLKNGISSGDRKKLNAVGITDDGKSQICSFKIQGDCDSGVNVQDWCYTVDSKKRTFPEAAKACEKKGSTLAVLHDDLDIQRLLKATTDLNPNRYWIGAATVDRLWEFHDSSPVDFFRFKAKTNFSENELAMVFQTKSKKNSYSGYEDASAVNNEYRFICAKQINHGYRKPISIYKFPDPVTTTTPKPTTRYPRIENPKAWITDPIKGQQIYRSYNSKHVLHHYNLNPVYKPDGFVAEKTPGFVVAEERFPEIEGTCPELLKVGIWKYLTMSYIGNNPPPQFTLSESFYCAPRQFYCGANFLLRRVDKVTGGDILYPSDDQEADTQLSVTGPAPATYRKVRGEFLETPCWVWQNYQETNNSLVKAGGGMIWARNDIYVHYQWSYGLDINEIPTQEQGNTKAGPGYVILEEAYEAYFKEKCPELIRMTVWHGSNGGLEYNTWFGRDGQSPPAHINTKVYQETRKFYCAPTQNYCGADFLLRRCDRTTKIANFGPQSWYPLSDALERDQKLWARKETFCYIWKRWTGNNIYQ